MYSTSITAIRCLAEMESFRVEVGTAPRIGFEPVLVRNCDGQTV